LTAGAISASARTVLAFQIATSMLAIASLLSGKSHGEAGPESHHDRGMLPVTLAFGFGARKVLQRLAVL